MANAFIGSQHIWPRVVLSPIAKTPYLQSSQMEKRNWLWWKRKRNWNRKAQSYQWTFVNMIVFFFCVPDKYEHVTYWACNHLFWPKYKLLKVVILPFHTFLISILVFFYIDKTLLKPKLHSPSEIPPAVLWLLVNKWVCSSQSDF